MRCPFCNAIVYYSLAMLLLHYQVSRDMKSIAAGPPSLHQPFRANEHLGGSLTHKVGQRLGLQHDLQLPESHLISIQCHL